MIPNNNLSVLPWYTSIEQQNARKWWVYGKIYPLFTPATHILPFQVMRPHRMETVTRRFDIDLDNPVSNTPHAYIYDDGDIVTLSSQDDDNIDTFEIPEDIPSNAVIYFENSHDLVLRDHGAAYALYNDGGEVLNVVDRTTYNDDDYSELSIQGARTLKMQRFRSDQASYNIYIEWAETIIRPIHLFEIYTKDGQLVGDYLSDVLEMGLTVKAFTAFDYDVIVFASQLPVFSSFSNGQYYIKMSDGVDTWYSDVYTAVNDIEPYLKLEWWDNEDFVMDAGTIVYKNPAFKNVLYLCADIAKPEYPFEEEGETRDGYFFPIKQISEKRYHFSFLASEYLLDVMRFIRMADFARITKNGQTYSLDTFLITPEWEDNGDVAAVDAEFDTATVAKKIGVGYIKAQRGDFNDDFNNDYSNQNQ